MREYLVSVNGTTLIRCLAMVAALDAAEMVRGYWSTGVLITKRGRIVAALSLL